MWNSFNFVAHLRRKMAELWLWTKILTKQCLVLGAPAFQCKRVGLLYPKYDKFACLHTRQDQNELHLKKWIAKIFCKSICWNIPNFVQAFTQPYSFGERIKLIICQIRYELSVTIHEIGISWKKNVRWRTLYTKNISLVHCIKKTSGISNMKEELQKSNFLNAMSRQTLLNFCNLLNCPL